MSRQPRLPPRLRPNLSLSLTTFIFHLQLTRYLVPYRFTWVSSRSSGIELPSVNNVTRRLTLGFSLSSVSHVYDDPTARCTFADALVMQLACTWLSSAPKKCANRNAWLRNTRQFQYTSPDDLVCSAKYMKC